MIVERGLSAGETIEADLCVIGSGPAGISLALALQASGLKIVVVAGGDWNERSEHRDLNRGEADPPGSHEPLEENRRRQFGGTSSAWGGRCIPFDPIDFKSGPGSRKAAGRSAMPTSKPRGSRPPLPDRRTSVRRSVGLSRCGIRNSEWRGW